MYGTPRSTAQSLRIARVSKLSRPSTIRSHSAVARRAPQDWRLLLAIYFATQVIESYGVSQVFAFMPLYLGQLGLPADQIPFWVGILGSFVFILGLPLVPLWGVWADKYSRKAVIIRSAVVEVVVFAGVAPALALVMTFTPRTFD